MAGQADRVTGDLPRTGLAELQPHQHARPGQPGEEPGLIVCPLRALETTFRSTARAAAADTPVPGTCRAPYRTAQRRRSFGNDRSAASFPPPYHTIPPSFAVPATGSCDSSC
jgi:hypothetical protein